ncbi:MAG: TonB-dependent receptor [Flavobacteriaceae bacterium]
MPRLILILVLSIYCLPLWSQNTQDTALEFQIRDAATANPLPYVSIYFEDLKQGGHSDENGFLSMQVRSSKDSLQVSISSVGYQSQKLKIAAQTSSRFSISLKEEATALETVQIQGRTGEAATELAGFASESVQLEEQSRQSVQLNQVVDRVAGITVRQEGGLGSDVSYSINGLTGNAVKIFIDGVPMDYYGESYSLASIPTNSIERVEVHKGVVPAELGGDILGGAINIVTKKSSDSSLNLSYSGGSFNTHQVSTQGSMRLENGFTFQGQIFYNYSDNNYEVWGDDVFIVDGITPVPVRAERFHDAYENIGTKFDIGVTDRNWADEFLISMLYTDTYKEVQHGATMIKPFGERFYTQKNLSPSLQYKKSDLGIEGLNLQSYVAYSDADRHLVDTTRNRYDWNGDLIPHPGADQGLEYPRGEAGSAQNIFTNEKTWILRENLAYDIDEQSDLSLNVVFSDYTRSGYNTEAVLGGDTEDNESNMLKNITGLAYSRSFYEGKLDMTLFSKHYYYATSSVEYQIQNGVYYPIYHDMKDSNWGYGLGLNYYLKEDLLMQFSAEKAVRLPVADELFGNASQNVNPAYGLQPEISYNYNLGLRLLNKKVGRSTYGLSSNLFYRNVSNLIQRSTQVVSGIDTFTYENFGKVGSKGIDLGLDYSYGEHLSANFSTSYNDTRYLSKTDINGRENIYYKSRMKNEPFFQFNTSAQYDFAHLLNLKGNLNLVWSARYVHWYYRHFENIGKDNKDILPTQFVNNMGLVYVFPNATSLSFDVQNLADKQVYDNFGIQLPGRAFYVKLNINIL